MAARQSAGRARREPFGMGLVVGAVVAVAVTLLIVQNSESTQVDWVTLSFKAPLWIVLLLTAIAGAVVWELLKVGIRRTRSSRRTTPPPA